MNTLDTQLGWMFASLTAIFALGLVPRFAPRFYPTVPSFRIRLVAPLTFAFLALAGFLGAAVSVLSAVVVLGVTLMIAGRRRRV